MKVINITITDSNNVSGTFHNDHFDDKCNLNLLLINDVAVYLRILKLNRETFIQEPN